MSHIFHIAKESVWRQARKTGAYTVDSLRSEGFIHCSEPQQVIETANRLFRSHTGLVLLRIEIGKLRAMVRYENLEGGFELFPHIYGELNIDAVSSVSSFEPSSSGAFDHHGQVIERGTP